MPSNDATLLVTYRLVPIGGAVVGQSLPADVVEAVSPGRRREDDEIGADERRSHRSVVARLRRLVVAGSRAGDDIEQRIQAEEVRHVLRGEHQAERRTAHHVPGVRARHVLPPDRLAPFVAPDGAQEEQHQEGVFLADPVDGDDVRVDSDQERGHRRCGRAEQQRDNAVDQGDRRRAGHRVRQPQRGLRGNRPGRRHRTIPDGRQVEARPHRQLHQHRMFGVGREIALPVALDCRDFR